MKTAKTAFNRTDIALVVIIVLVAISARIVPGPRTIDDAFITFRYSRNIVEGQGFVYNPGSQVLGTTTPLFTVLMASISAILHGQDFPIYAMVVSAIADAGTCVLLFLIARRLTGNRWVGVLLGLLWAIAPQSVTFAIGGMETSLNILWMVGAVWFYITDRPIWMGIFAGLGFLTRIDAVLWIGPLFMFQLIEQLRGASPLSPHLRGGKGQGDRKAISAITSRLPLTTWIVFLVVLLPWLIFSLGYFGSPFPRSLTAKTVAYILPPGSAFIQFIRIYSTPFFEFDTFGSNGAKIGSIAYLTLSLIGLRYTYKRMPRIMPFFLYTWLYMAVFSIANPLMFRWYMTPPLPALMIQIIIGAWSIIETVQKSQRRRQWITPTAIGVLAILWGGMSLRAWVIHPDHGPDRPAPSMAWHQIELYYQQIGSELREKYGVTSETKVASADIGAIGYFSRATIIDTVGLVTPALSAYYPVDPALIVKEENQNYAIPPQLIKDTAPEYFVTMEAFVRLGLEKDAEFKAQYGEPIEKIPTGFYGTDMRLYRRR